jgi:hypothetical protein
MPTNTSSLKASIEISKSELATRSVGVAHDAPASAVRVNRAMPPPEAAT